MASSTVLQETPTTQLLLSSGNGPVSRTVLATPPRDAMPSEIPVIDISGLSSPDLAARKLVAQKIHEAATNTGFFYISHHGIPEEAISAARKACLDFFRQPAEIKERANIAKSSCFNGYKPAASQRINPFESVDKREAFSFMYDPRYDPLVKDIAAIPKHISDQLHSEDFPWEATANLSHFKPAIIEYWRCLLGLARALVRSFALSLDLEEEFFDSKVSHPDAVMAMNYYPPIERADNPALATTQSLTDEVSIGSHTDFQLFTILWQDERGGLQVLNREGQWINAKPLEGTFVVNIADYLQRITNDRYVSTVHRVRNLSGFERISMPYFVGFNWNESCAVLDSCVGEGESKKYDEISCADWVKRRARAMHQTDSPKA